MEVTVKTILKFAVIVGVAGIAAAAAVQAASAEDPKAAPQLPVAEQQLAPGLVMPVMDPVRGKKLFASTGCVVCHSINGVGGNDAPKLDAATMAPMMNPFEFFAKMWRGAAPMIAMQQEEIGHQIEFSGQDLADIVAFAHNRQVQKTFSAADIPPAIKKRMKSD